MGIEAATYLADLQPTNPTSTDLRSQGDDHLRLIKSVLQTTFPGASRANPVGAAPAKTANYTVVKNDGNSVIFVGTGAGSVTLTLPTLAALDAGWTVWVFKTSQDVNPVFIAPPSGNLQSGEFSGLAKARRAIPGVMIPVIWNGTGFVVGRASALPVASPIPCYRSGLPSGYEWPNGQTLASVATNYPEYNAAVGSGVTPDLRGRVAVGLDNMGGAAGRIGSIIGAGLGGAGGSETVTLSASQIPSHTHSGTTGNENQNFNHTYTSPNNPNVLGVAAGAVNINVVQGAFSTFTSIENQAHNHSFTTDGGTGGGQAHSNIQPSYVLAMALLVE